MDEVVKWAKGDPPVCPKSSLIPVDFCAGLEETRGRRLSHSFHRPLVIVTIEPWSADPILKQRRDAMLGGHAMVSFVCRAEGEHPGRRDSHARQSHSRRAGILEIVLTSLLWI